MNLFFSRHNWHRVWERSIFNSEANFFAWKIHILIVFRKNYSRLAYLLFIWAPKRLYKSGWNGKTMSKGLKTERELAAEWNCTAQVMLWMYVFTYAFLTWNFPFSSLQLVHSWRPLSFFFFGSEALENICEVSAC